MKRNASARSASGLRERKTDLIFAGIALLLVLVMIVFLIRYNTLKKENASMTKDYGSVTEELVQSKKDHSALENQIETASQQIGELNKKIAALEGK